MVSGWFQIKAWKKIGFGIKIRLLFWRRLLLLLLLLLGRRLLGRLLLLRLLLRLLLHLLLRLLLHLLCLHLLLQLLLLLVGKVLLLRVLGLQCSHLKREGHQTITPINKFADKTRKQYGNNNRSMGISHQYQPPPKINNANKTSKSEEQ